MVLALAGMPASAAASPGDLDPTFGTGGVTSLAPGTTFNGVAAQSDRAVVATGTSGSSLLVQRFSASGVAQAPFSAGAGVGRGVVIQPDGKIVVAGYDAGGMLVERFNPSGGLDPSFGIGGVVHAAPGAQANAVALGPGGTIVAAGQVRAGDGFQRAEVLRLSSSGTPDASLGPGGARLVDLGQDSVANGVAVQADGKIVLAGSVGPGIHQGIAALIARLTASGGVDTSFGGGGVTYSFAQAGGGASVFNAVSLDPAGGIVVGGGSTATNQSAALIGRLTCSGAFDPSFAAGGLAVVPSSRNFVTTPYGANAVAVASARRVVAAGQYHDSALNAAAVWGFEASGSADFATIAPSEAAASAIVVDSAGSLVVAGSKVPTGLAPSGFVARYLGFGAPASGTAPCGGTAVPPPAVAPSATTGAAPSVNTSSATVSGSINPNGSATTYDFEYGTSTAYGSATGSAPAGSGTASVGASATLTGLSSGTTYHYRLVATNSAGTTVGSDATFKTLGAGPPPPVPTLTNVTQSHRRWRETKSKGYKGPVGTSFFFTLNMSARVTVAITQAARGSKVNGKCVARTSKNRLNPVCTRTLTRGSLSVAGHRGVNTVSFNGSISAVKKLAPGTFTVSFTATSSSRKKSKTRSLTFTIAH